MLCRAHGSDALMSKINEFNVKAMLHHKLAQIF